MSEKKYHCRKCGAEVLAGPYVAPELCHACQLVAHAEQSASSDITSEMVYRVAELHGTIKQQAAEIERLRAYTAAYNTLLAERVEIECLRGLAVRAWRSLCAGDKEPIACDGGLTSGDIAELTALTERYEANGKRETTDA